MEMRAADAPVGAPLQSQARHHTRNVITLHKTARPIRWLALLRAEPGSVDAYARGTNAPTLRQSSNVPGDSLPMSDRESDNRKGTAPPASAKNQAPASTASTKGIP